MTDEMCTVCHEPKSAHVPTSKGPLTHPREARGEGEYVNGRFVPTVRCPRCSSSRLDTGIRTDPETRELRKRCHCDDCGHEFWRPR